ncbi:MAG: cytochrome P450 [Pseudomonadales bacterium]|nr:cytochrome P450 [Pseudomonadales bacterium]
MDLSYQQRPANQDLSHISGERGLPFLGNILTIGYNPYSLVDRLYKQHGPVAKFNMLNQPVLMITGADINQMIYLDRDKNFSAMMGYEESLVEFYKGGLLVRDFDDHKLHRRMFQTAFKNDIMRRYTESMNEVIEANISTWADQPNFHFFPNIKRTLLDIAGRTFLGIDDFQGEEAKHISEVFEDITLGMMGIIRWDSPLVPFTKWRKGKQAMRFMENYLISQIEERRASDKHDMFSLICQETDEQGNYFSNDDIAAHINFLLFAAHDTTTSNLSYIMQYLGQDKAIQQQAREQSQAKNKPYLVFDDLNDMSALQNIHYEALRMHPSVMMMARRTLKDCEIDGTFVPADTVLNIFPQYVHMMAEHWDHPERFDPDRFSPERAEHKRHPFQFVPFGGGAHKCIGLHFAGMIVKCVMHQMLLRYEWEVPAGYQPEHQVFPMPKQKDDLPLRLTAL